MSLNHCSAKVAAVAAVVSRDLQGQPREAQEVNKFISRLMAWEGQPQKVKALSPKDIGPSVVIPSNTRHGKPGVNPGGPPPKAKYYWTTDSAIVARAKGEKHPG